MLSIVIPVLNGAETLAGTLANVAGAADEVVVVDGGSDDGSPAAAAAAGARVVDAPPGRGGQLRAGAAAAKGDWLLFLHADTRLSENWPDAVSAHRRAAGADGRAGYFRLRFDDPAWPARRTSAIANWRARRLGLPFGDQGLLIARQLYERIGGYRPLPIMEDVDIARRLGRSRLAALPADATTSAARYRRSGWTARSARNLTCLGMYFAGVAPARIKRIYD